MVKSKLKKSKIEIVSDGTVKGTEIKVNGVLVEGASFVNFTLDMFNVENPTSWRLEFYKRLKV